MTTRATHDYEALCQLAAQKSTDEQAITLVKMIKMGWQVTKVVTDHQVNKSAISLCLGKTAAWLMPNASIKRAAVGRSTVTIAYEEIRA